MQSPFEIAIIGAGVAGLSLALGLQKDPRIKQWCNITIYEADTTPRDAEGHAIVCRPEYQVAKKMVGTAEPGAFTEESPCWMALMRANPAFHTYASPAPWLIQDGKSDGKPPRKREPFERQFFSVRRGLFVKALREIFEEGETRVQWSKALRGIDIGDRYTLHFKDGSTALADTVIGADGINSVVRHSVMDALGVSAAATPTGGVNFRKMVPTAQVRRIFGDDYTDPVCQWPHVADGVFFLTDYCDGGDTCQIVADFPFGGWPQGQRGKIEWDKAKAREKFESYGWIGRKYCEAFGLYERGDRVDFSQEDNDDDVDDDGDDTLWAWPRKTHLEPAPSFVHPTEALVVIGDAAQAFLPYAGAGASEASADGMVIANIVRMLLADMEEPARLREAVRGAYLGFTAVRQAKKAEMATLGDRRAHTMTGDSPMGLDIEKWKPARDSWENSYAKTEKEAQDEAQKDLDTWRDALKEGKRIAQEHVSYSSSSGVHKG